MIVCLAVVFAIGIVGIKIRQTEEPILTKEQTTCINGIFVLLVFLSHVQQYITLGDNLLDKMFDFSMGVLGQNIVISFLLFSGYGIGEQIKKRDNYVHTIPFRRIMCTWIHFMIAVVLYWLINAIWVKHSYDVGDYLLSLIALQSIGNSTWYVFAILICWLSTFIAYTIIKNKDLAILMVSFLLVIYIIIMYNVKPQHCWYDTVLCYPLGLLVSRFKNSINTCLQNKSVKYTVLIASCSWVVLRLFVEKNVVLYEVQSIIFAIWLLIIINKFEVSNSILSFCGKHTFSIYILQRLPMIILSYYGINAWNPLVFTGICMVITCIMAIGFDLLMKQIDKPLLSHGARI